MREGDGVQERRFTQVMKATSHDAWWFLADLCNDPVWRQEVITSTLVSGEPRNKGAVYEEHIRWMQFQSDVSLSIVDADESSTLVVASEGTGYRSRSLWTFQPAPQGATLNLIFSMEATGAFALAEGLVTDMIEKWIRRDLSHLQDGLPSLDQPS